MHPQLSGVSVQRMHASPNPSPGAQVAAFLAGLHHSRRFRPSIVVCPATVLRQWLRELRCWYPPFRVVVLHESQRTGHLPRPPRECALPRILGYSRVCSM